MTNNIIRAIELQPRLFRTVNTDYRQVTTVTNLYDVEFDKKDTSTSLNTPFPEYHPGEKTLVGDVFAVLPGKYLTSKIAEDINNLTDADLVDGESAGFGPNEEDKNTVYITSYDGTVYNMELWVAYYDDDNMPVYAAYFPNYVSYYRGYSAASMYFVTTPEVTQYIVNGQFVYAKRVSFIVRLQNTSEVRLEGFGSVIGTAETPLAIEGVQRNIDVTERKILIT